MNAPTVSVVLPTFNRPELLRSAITSILTQTYSDFELIVVDDGDKVSAETVVQSFHDARIVYLKNNPPKQGGGATRNRGIAITKGEWVAFLDDDDEWLPEKLAMQMQALADVPDEVGFSFTAVVNDDGKKLTPTTVIQGIYDYKDIALRSFAGFLTVTLVLRKSVLLEVGGFDEILPSHQEPELMIRVTRKYKGFGVNQPLVKVNMTPHEHIGGDIKRRIRGREIILEKHSELYKHYPEPLAYHNFQLGLWCRDSGDITKAKQYFWRAFTLSWNPRHLAHYLLVCYKKDFVCQ